MNSPTFLHVCVNWHTRDAMIRLYWSFMQHYPGAFLAKTSHHIMIPGIMRHVFVAADFEFERLYGFELKGFDIEYGAEVSKQQVLFLHSRVRS